MSEVNFKWVSKMFDDKPIIYTSFVDSLYSRNDFETTQHEPL